MKKLLIITGPQGSGNHVWSKIFALHPDVLGWQELLESYWIGHDREPFNDYWRNPERLLEFDWSQSDFYVTSISVPYMENGRPTIPDIAGFMSFAREAGVDVELAAIGRDRNILTQQETRLRGGQTYNQALAVYEQLKPNYFLSYELLQLYQRQYLEMLSAQMQFPIDWQSPEIDTIIEDDANAKYFSRTVTHYWVDDLARKTSSPWY